MKIELEHVIAGISLAAYEQLFFDEPFNLALCEHVKLQRRLIRREDAEGGLVREVEVGPEREIPAAVAKVLGATRLVYSETVNYRWGSYQASWKTVPAVLANKVHSAGTYTFASHPEGIVRRVEGEIAVKMFAVGGLVERFIAAETEQSFNQAAEFTTQWIKDRA